MTAQRCNLIKVQFILDFCLFNICASELGPVVCNNAPSVLLSTGQMELGWGFLVGRNPTSSLLSDILTKIFTVSMDFVPHHCQISYRIQGVPSAIIIKLEQDEQDRSQIINQRSRIFITMLIDQVQESASQTHHLAIAALPLILAPINDSIQPIFCHV